MKKIRITDTTFRERTTLTFKEKTVLAKQLAQLGVNAVEMGRLAGTREDELLLKTIAPFLDTITVSCDAGDNAESAGEAWKILSAVGNPMLTVSLPTSTIQMEYFYHKKPAVMLELAKAQVSACAALCKRVEFRALDATRSDIEFLAGLVGDVIAAGATTVTVCDSEGAMLADEFGAFLAKLEEACPSLAGVELCAECSDAYGLAGANSLTAVCDGVGTVKTTLYGAKSVKLESFINLVVARGVDLGISTDVKATEIHRAVSEMSRFGGGNADGVLRGESISESDDVTLSSGATIKTVSEVVRHLGYELSPSDIAKVFEAFERVSVKKNVNGKELETIIADVAQQAPPTYTLSGYIINSGDRISPMAQVELEKDGETRRGLCIGDGPIDAALRAIEQVIGTHYELDDFQIRAVTEGQEAMGEAFVRLRSRGKLYSGSGISTDIIGASIRAYLNALNKIVYDDLTCDL